MLPAEAVSGFPAITEDVVRRYDVAGPRYTSYPTVPQWTEGFTAADYAERLERAGRSDPNAPLSIYVHLPFCEQMCTYCGCNVVISKDRQVADRYIDHLAREMALAAERLGARRTVSQLHWGGGTPTFLSLEQIERLGGEIASRFALTGDAEVSVEIDPVVTSQDQLALLGRLGFNRLSMGVQDLSPEVQQAVHRIQTVEKTRAVLTEARRLGFGSVNFDLIYGLPNQTPERWSRTLAQIVELRPDRLAVYSFAYVPELRAHQRKLDASAIPTGPAKLELFRMAYDAFGSAGYRPIGMDHFALPHDELVVAQAARRLTRNFQGYTVKAAAGDVVAFGATGISDLTGAFAQNVRPLPKYYSAVSAGRFATERGIALSDDDRRRRAVIMQLMCNFWVDLGPDGARDFAGEIEALRTHEREGLLSIDGTAIELTPVGRVFVRNVAMIFDAYLEKPHAKAQFSRTV